MSRLFTFAATGTLAAFIGATAWSQTAQSGGAGTAGATGASSSGAGAGASAAGQVGISNSAANAGAAGQANAGLQVQSPGNPGEAQFISPRPTGNNFDFNDPLRRPFFMDPGARRELMMNNQQFNRLNQAHQQSFLQFNEALNQLNSNPNLTPQQRAAELRQLRAQFNQRFGQTVDTVFTDPRLRQRFNQLDWQFRPFAAFNDATVSRRLQLTPQQQRQLRELGFEWREQMQRLRRAGSNAASDPQVANQQFAAMQAQFQQQMQQVMTPQQQQVWAQITGEPFNFPPTAFFPQGDDSVGVAQRPRLDNSFLRNGTQQQNAPRNVPPQEQQQQQDQSFLRGQGAQQQNAPQNAPQQSGQPRGTTQQNTVR